jgi:hypothetical protein
MNGQSRRRQLTANLRRALQGALEWRLLTVFTGTVVWTTLVASFPAWRVLGSVLDDSPRAKEIASSFDLVAFADMGMALYRSAAPVTGGLALATLLGVLSWPFLAGMAVGAAGKERPRTFAQVLDGGIAYYTRMLRIGLVSIVPFALVGAVATAAFKGARQYGRHAIFESQATLGWRIALVLTLLVFVLMHATIEAGRSAFGADDHLRSGWGAWWRGVRLILNEPLGVLVAYLGTTLASYALAAVFLVFRLRLSGPSWVALVLGFVLTQLAVASLGWGRAARLFALTALARSRLPVSESPSEMSEAAPDGVHVVRADSMFRELDPRKPVARRG